MPVVDYSKTLIYKIQHQTKDELLYVGSTTHFGNRKVRHKCTCYDANNNKYNYKLYTTIRSNGGWDAFNMVIVKPFPCENKRQVEAEEDKVMREMKASLNMKKAFTTPEERREQKKDYQYKNKEKIKEQHKEYEEKNKEKIKERKKEYYDENRDKILERCKEYQYKNTDKIRERSKEYYDKNRDKFKEYREQNRDKIKEYREQNKYKFSEKINCACGCVVTKGYLAKHLKTNKHQEYLNQQTDQ